MDWPWLNLPVWSFLGTVLTFLGLLVMSWTVLEGGKREVEVTNAVNAVRELSNEVREVGKAAQANSRAIDAIDKRVEQGTERIEKQVEQLVGFATGLDDRLRKLIKVLNRLVGQQARSSR